jgi:predicted AAA+ superfamily ATPase
MDIVEELYRQNPWWEEIPSFDFVERAFYLDLLKGQLKKKDIVFVVGLRRVGKTTLFRMLVEYLLSVVSPRKILYVTLDSYNLGDSSIHGILEEYRKEHKLKRSEKIFLFLDEITYKDDFSLELKNLYDLENIKIFAGSSSSASVIGKKTYLTGRSRMIEILPLDFGEFLLFKDIKVKKSEKYLLEKYFEDYMRYGGMPEFVLTGDVSYIYSLLDDIIYKDIVSIHKVKDVKVVKDFFKMLMERSGKKMSLNKIAKVMDISVDTARRFFNYFSSTFLVYPIEKCGKLNERLRAPKKIYAADVGIRNTITGFRDKGAIFENLVFLKIKNNNPCYIYQDGIEIDFKVNNKLVEAKYQSEMNIKQQDLFARIKAKKKILVSGMDDYLTFKM